jgi:hypothetical protein
MRTLLQDLQYGIRMFARNPTFTLVAVLALALGIGATTIIFSVVDTVLLKPLPYPDSGRLVSIGLTGFGAEALALAPDYLEWRARNHVFEEMAAYSASSPTLTGASEPTRLECAQPPRVSSAHSEYSRCSGGPFRWRKISPAERR